MFGDFEPGDVMAIRNVPDVGGQEVNPQVTELAWRIIDRLPKEGGRAVGLDPVTLLAIAIGLAQLVIAVIKYCDDKRLKRLVRRAHERPRGIAAGILRLWFKNQMPDKTPVKELFPLVVEWGVSVANADEEFRALQGVVGVEAKEEQ